MAKKYSISDLKRSTVQNIKVNNKKGICRQTGCFFASLLEDDVRNGNESFYPGGGGGEVLPYMSYIGMCRCEGYGFTESLL